MIIKGIETELNDGHVTLSVNVVQKDVSTRLWYRFDKSVSEYLTTEKYDGFLVALLPLAMRNGEDIYIEGAISEKLYYNLSNYYQSIVSTMFHNFKQIKVHAKSLDNSKDISPPKGTITGFSAGVDSFNAIHIHYNEKTPQGFKLTHLLNNNVGGHENKSGSAKLFQSRTKLTQGFANDTNLKLINVDSNLSEIFEGDFQKTHLSRNTSSVLMLQKLIGKYFYASGYRYKDCYIGETYDSAFADPSTVHLLSTETLECIATGSQFSRVEKTMMISNIAEAEKYLNVCVWPKADGKNCSFCWKCCRTLFTLELVDDIEKYAAVFNLPKWRWAKKWYISEEILNPKNTNEFNEEIREVLKQKGITFSFKQRLLGHLISLIPEKTYKKFKNYYLTK